MGPTNITRVREKSRPFGISGRKGLRMSLSDGWLTRTKAMRIREFGPMFGKIEHNEVLYEAMLFSRSCAGAFKKQAKQKTNKLVNLRLVHDLKQSARSCWRTMASSKVKSTQWLLINHALPVEARIRRHETAICKLCGKGEATIAHDPSYLERDMSGESW